MDYIITTADGSEHLAHYGVLGMRWGVRHDKKFKAAKAKIKGNQKFSKEQQKKAINEEKVKTANRLYSTNSSATNRKIQTRSTAKTIGMSALLGSYGTLHYDRARTGDSYSRGKAAVRGIVAAYLNAGSYGAAGWHNYVVDRRGRKAGATSGSKNRDYISLNNER